MVYLFLDHYANQSTFSDAERFHFDAVRRRYIGRHPEFRLYMTVRTTKYPLNPPETPHPVPLSNPLPRYIPVAMREKEKNGEKGNKMLFGTMPPVPLERQPRSQPSPQPHPIHVFHSLRDRDSYAVPRSLNETSSGPFSQTV